MRVSSCAVLITALIAALPAQDYYVDPLAGNMSNAGTATEPWSTLEEVCAANKSFAGGDKIFLRRGNHGAPTIHGSGSGAGVDNRVTILAEAGHAPILRWVVFSGAQFWALENIFVNSEVPGGVEAPKDRSRFGLIVLRNKSNQNVIRNVGACSTQDPLGWAANESGWTEKGWNGVFIDIGGGSNNLIERVYCLNLHNGISSNAPDNTFAHNVVENYCIDGVRPNAANFKFYYNIVMNSIMNDHTKPSGSRQHRDMWQAIGDAGKKDNHEAIGNQFIALADPSLLPLICSFKETSATKYIEVCAPVFAGWDGPFNNDRFENNIILTDHQTGIWFNNASNCRVVNNTMAGITAASRGPTIRIGQKSANDKKPSTATNVVYNNITAGPLDFQNADKSPTVSGSGNNLVITGGKGGKFFLTHNLLGLDMRLSGGAVAAINCANPTFAPPLDADENKRSAPDIGAYEFGKYTAADTVPPSAPGKPRVIIIPGLGADLEWKESTDNRKVMGYDVFRGKVRIGRTRSGPRFFDVFTGSTAHFTGDEASLTYTIKAFDAWGNGTFGPTGKSGK